MASSSSPKPAFPSKPLHNFELPTTLKWNKQPKDTNRRRSSSSSAVKSPTTSLDSNSKIQKTPPIKINPPKNNTVSDKKPDLHPKSNTTAVEKKPISSKPASSKIVLKLPPKNNINTEAMTTNEKPEKEKEQTLMDLKIEINNGKGKAVAGLMQDEGNVIDDKLWKSKPRRPALRKRGTKNNNNTDVTNVAKNNNNNVNQVVAAALENEGRGVGGDRDEEEKVMTNLYVALNKEAIDEDMYSFYERKHTKRPKRRDKSVQKTLDCLFPGLGLTNITADRYKVSENDMKG